MSRTECNYQRKVSIKELSAAFGDARCNHCGITTADLAKKGDLLEVCGDEFSYDMETGERILTPIALCPECHRKNHLDSHRKHNPCQLTARADREGLT
jgi:hypothetical protein